jgi:hypothetical protein
MNEKIKTIVRSIKDEIQEDILVRYHNIEYWDTELINNRIEEENLSESEKFEVIKEIYGCHKTKTISDLPEWIQDEFNLNELDEEDE